MPIIGEGDEEANDSFVEQLVTSAEAAVEEVVRRGVRHCSTDILFSAILLCTGLYCTVPS